MSGRVNRFSTDLMESPSFAIVPAMITSAQCRAARGLLDWTQQDLAERARVGIVTVRQVEAGVSEPRRATLEVIRRALEGAGVEFIDENGGGAGVRLRQRRRPKTPKK
jgi:transcriptional regulator with XRE-family HTH domain